MYKIMHIGILTKAEKLDAVLILGVQHLRQGLSSQLPPVNMAVNVCQSQTFGRQIFKYIAQQQIRLLKCPLTIAGNQP